MAYQGNHPLNAQAKHNPHVQTLLHKHAQLENELRTEQANPAARDEDIKKLKLAKLHVTEQIMRFQVH